MRMCFNSFFPQPVLLRPLANLCFWHPPIWLHWCHGGADCCHGCHAHLITRGLPRHRHLDVQCKYLDTWILTWKTTVRTWKDWILSPQLYFFSLNQLVTLFGVACGIYSMFKVTNLTVSVTFEQLSILSDGWNNWQNFHWGCWKSRQYGGGESHSNYYPNVLRKTAAHMNVGHFSLLPNLCQMIFLFAGHQCPLPCQPLATCHNCGLGGF